jgi:hypothetical protein
MTIDKIKHHMPTDIFNYWTALKNGNLPYEEKRSRIKTAIKQLSTEIEKGLRNEIKDHAELNYLKLLIS